MENGRGDGPAEDGLMTTVRHVKESPWHINRNLLPVKGYYFFFLAAVGALLPFFPIYLKQMHLTAEEAGIMYGIIPFFGFFIRPFICAMADRWQKHKQAMMLCSILTGGFFLLVLTVPGRMKPALTIHTQLDCNIQDSYFRDCPSKDGKLSMQSPCHYELSDFAAKQSSWLKEKETVDADCALVCSESENSISKDVEVCFTNSYEPFDKQCNGSHVLVTPFTFTLQNISHIINKKLGDDKTIMVTPDCQDYDLKLLAFNDSQYWKLLCDKEGTFKCQMTCTQLDSQLCQTHEHEFDATFGWIFLIVFIANMAFAPIFSLMDTATLIVLGPKPDKFGEQRLWGTVGFSLFGITSTFIMHMLYQQGSTVDYSVCFYIFVVLCMLATVDAYWINWGDKVVSTSMFKNFLALFKVLEICVFLLVVLFFGMAFGAIESFLFWYLSDLGAETIIFGLSTVINCAFEVPLLFASGILIRKVGTAACLYVALLAMAVRFLCYSFLVDPWYVLFIEPLDGLTFAIMWPAATNKAAQIAPPGLSATTQGLLGGLKFGIGRGLGSIVMGILIKNIGARWSFRLFSFLCLGVLLCYALADQLCFKRTDRSSDEEIRSGEDQNSPLHNHPLLDGAGDNSFDRTSDAPGSPTSRERKK